MLGLRDHQATLIGFYLNVFTDFAELSIPKIYLKLFKPATACVRD